MKNINLKSEPIKLLTVLIVTIIFGAVLFILNNMTGLLNIFLFIIQAFLGIIFSLWYFRIFLGYFKELRPKQAKIHIGIPKGWSIFGLISTIINMIFWGILSSLIFNVPKILFLIPFIIAFVQIGYVFIKANRRKAKDWLLLLYNIVAFLYLLNWTLVDFGVDLPNILGVFSHTINTNAMWWQLIFVNTSALFSPTFLFPPLMLNPRYYLAMPVEEYYKSRGEELSRPKSVFVSKYTKDDLVEQPERTEEKERKLPGEREPLFEERKKLEEQKEELEAIRQEIKKKDIDEDERYADFVGSNDFSFQMRRYINGLGNIVKNISLGIILILIIITPISFAGNVSLNIIPNYQKNDYTLKTDMILGIKGNVFSAYSTAGNLSSNWSEDLDAEILLAKELHATHIRYDIAGSALYNIQTRSALATGLQRIKDEGLKLILKVTGERGFTKTDTVNSIYTNASYIAQNYAPDYMLIFNELNGELAIYSEGELSITDWYADLQNVSTKIKSLSPTTKTITTVLASKEGMPIFEELLENSTLNIDVIGITFYPLFFGWRLSIIDDFVTIREEANTTKDFWITETGLESFNFGEDAQSKYLAKIASLSSSITNYNLEGLCISSLIDNIGVLINQGVINHMGLVYFNGRKKKAFNAISYAFGKISGEI